MVILRKDLKGGIMKRELAIPYVSYVVDDAGCGRSLGDDPHAVVRDTGSQGLSTDEGGFNNSSVLVGWQCGFEPLFVAVHSYLDVRINDGEAEDMAAEYLEEIGWFSDNRVDCDYIIR